MSVVQSLAPHVTSAGVSAVGGAGVGVGLGVTTVSVWLTTQTPPTQLELELHIIDDVQGLFGGARQTFSVASQTRPVLQFASVVQVVPIGVFRIQRSAKYPTITKIITAATIKKRVISSMTDPDVYVVYRSEELTNNHLPFRAKANQIKMFRNRGFTIPDDQSIYDWKTPADYDRSFRVFERKLRRSPMNVSDYLSGAYYKEETDEHVWVAFIDNPNNNTKELVTRVNLICVEMKINKVFAVTGEKINRDNLASFDLIGISWEIHRLQDMSVSRLFHVLDSKATPLTEEEKQEFYERTKICAYQLAQYKRQDKNKKHKRDPILQNYDLPKGTLVKILHENYFLPTVAKETVAYRVVW